MDETTETAELYDYYVDSYGNEGIVFYVSQTTYSDLVIVISSDETELSWGPMGQTVVKTDSISYYDLRNNSYGLAVLQQMALNGIERYPAQNWCNLKNRGRSPYSGSWRLPSVEEWEKICSKSAKLNDALAAIGGDPLDAESFYWTSTEDFLFKFEGEEATDNDPANRAVPMSLNKTAYTNKDRWLKEMKYKVRAIKYILYAN